MSLKIPAVLLVIIFDGFANANAGEVKWIEAPRPKFPETALKAFAEGSVTLGAVIAPDGTVASVRVTKTSGNAQLDAAAVGAMLKWKMDPASITPRDLKEGHSIIFDFRQEAMPGARYSDRDGWFSGDNSEPWVFAPFAAYSEYARRSGQQGTVRLKATIGAQGAVSKVEILKSSGHRDLDEAAVTAVRYWRAHKQYEGRAVAFGIHFQLRRR